MLDTKGTQGYPLTFFLPSACCTGPLTARETHPCTEALCKVSSHQFPKAQPLLTPLGAAITHCSVQLSQLSREISGSKAAADGDKKCFQCSKTIIPLCLIKFSAAIRYSKTMCSFEKSLSFHTSPLKCPPYFGSQMGKYWERGFVILIISLPHMETISLGTGRGLCYCVTLTGPAVL